MRKKIIYGVSFMALAACVLLNLQKVNATQEAKGAVVKTICCDAGAIIGYSSNCSSGIAECADQICQRGSEKELTECPKGSEF